MRVPFVDLKAQYESIKKEITEAIGTVLQNTAYILGEQVELFEQEFASYCGVDFGVGVNSGTTALHLTLLASNVGPGDEVITVPNTFIATAEAISLTGAKPVFVDVEPDTYNIDVTKVEAAITRNTKAIIPVHLYGQPADMDPLLDIAHSNNLVVIEDSCQAHGAEYKGKKAGALGDAGCFSFYPSKNLGALGEGGFVATNNEKMADTVRVLRDHGQKRKSCHDIKGINGRLEGIQGAVLRAKLRKLEEWNNHRREKAFYYNRLLDKLPVTTPSEAEYAKHVYHLYVIRAQNRAELSDWLSENSVATGIHYPIPIHLQKAYADLGHKAGDFPVVEEHVKEIVSLPMFPHISEDQVEYVVDTIRKFLS